MAVRKTGSADNLELVTEYIKGRSALSLAQEKNLSIQTVLRRLREADVIVRKTGRVPPKTLALTQAHQTKLLEIVDGLMLGDGSISATGVLRLDQCLRREEWVRDVEKRLLKLGVPCRVSYSKAARSSIRGRLVKGTGSVFVYTPCFLELKKQRQRWYPEGKKKKVPQDISLSPLALSLWFCGDGTTSKTGLVFFCTQSFTLGDVEFLASRLWECHRIHSTPSWSGDGYGYLLSLMRKNESYHLRQLIEDQVPSVFWYKLDPIRPAIPRGRALRRLSDEQVRQVFQRRAEGKTNISSGQLFGVSGVTIANILCGKIYKDCVPVP